MRIVFVISMVVLTMFLGACSFYDEETAYFNTYYNMERIMGEIKDEFDYQDENRRIKPRVLVPGLDSAVAQAKEGTIAPPQYQFLKAFIIDRGKLQPVSTKVDSILQKGSKIIAYHPKTSYVQGSLFLMAESYFFKSEWVPSQQKCIELIERYADGDYSPDAHLLLAKDYLIQRKISQGKQTLSKTIDVAWYKDRYDILSEAYRIQAELAMEEGQLDEAVAPYKQAIAQSEDDGIRAAWQVDVASIYYRQGRFALAAEAFENVDKYTPDIMAEFESRLYHAAAMVRLGKLDTAENEFAALEDNKNYSEWASYIAAERLALDRARKGDLQDPGLIAQERKADTAFIGRPELMAQNFQKAMAYYKQNDYEQALAYFAKAKVIRTPVYEVAAKYYTLLKQWEDQTRKVYAYRATVVDRQSQQDTLNIATSREVYALARIHEQLKNTDSALYYYRYAYDSTTSTDPERSRYLYSQARLLSDTDPEEADSLMMVLNERWPNSPYGKEASASLGFTSDAITDDASDLYRSAQSFRRIKDYAYASNQYRLIAEKFATSSYAPKALYAMGWMFERDVNNMDSALYYYGLLVERYPKSDYAKEVFPSVEYALAKRNNVEVADSLLLKDLDNDLLQKAKAGEKDVMQQMINNNLNSMQIKTPDVLNNLNIPGSTPGSSPGDMLQQQIKNFKGLALPKDSLGTPRSDTVAPIRKP